MDDTQLEIQHFLITGTTPRNVMFVSQSLNRVVYLPEAAPVFWGDTRVDISEEAVYMQCYRHKTGEDIYIEEGENAFVGEVPNDEYEWYLRCYDNHDNFNVSDKFNLIMDVSVPGDDDTGNDDDDSGGGDDDDSSPPLNPPGDDDDDDDDEIVPSLEVFIENYENVFAGGGLSAKIMFSGFDENAAEVFLRCNVENSERETILYYAEYLDLSQQQEILRNLTIPTNATDGEYYLVCYTTYEDQELTDTYVFNVGIGQYPTVIEISRNVLIAAGVILLLTIIFFIYVCVKSKSCGIVLGDILGGVFKPKSKRRRR